MTAIDFRFTYTLKCFCIYVAVCVYVCMNLEDRVLFIVLVYLILDHFRLLTI